MFSRRLICPFAFNASASACRVARISSVSRPDTGDRSRRVHPPCSRKKASDAVSPNVFSSKEGSIRRMYSSPLSRSSPEVSATAAGAAYGPGVVPAPCGDQAAGSCRRFTKNRYPRYPRPPRRTMARMPTEPSPPPMPPSPPKSMLPRNPPASPPIMPRMNPPVWGGGTWDGVGPWDGVADETSKGTWPWTTGSTAGRGGSASTCSAIRGCRRNGSPRSARTPPRS